MLKGKLIMMISTVVLLVAGLVSASLSWYTSQEQVTANDASVSAEQSISASLSSNLVEDSHYGGETGKGPSTHEDAPYSIDIEISLFASALTDTTYLKVQLSSLIIGKGTLAETEKYILETNTPEDDMTIRVDVSGVIYKLNQDGYLVLESNPTTFYEVANGENAFIVSLIYLDEERYLQWQIDDQDSMDEFLLVNPQGMTYFEWLATQPEYFAYSACAYSEPVYMYSYFYVSMNYLTETAPGA